MEHGYISLHRKLAEWEWYDDPNTKSLFIHILLFANWKDNKWHGMEIKRGSLVASQCSLAEKLGLSRQELRSSLVKLKSTNEITIKTTKTYTLITVNKYDSYQTPSYDEQPREQPREQPTSNQQATNKQPLLNKVIRKEDNKAALLHNLKDKIRKISDVIYHSGKWDKVNAFVNHFKNYNQEALLHTLEQFYKHSNNGRTIEHPWAYCLEIMKIENGNFNEREAIAAHNAIKDITKDFKLSDITKGEKNEKVATKEA